MKKINKILSIILAILMVISIIPLTASAGTPTSGVCGDNVIWEFDETTSTLTISGEGAMYDYEKEFYSSNHEVDTRPWKSFYSLIEHVVINDGVTYIGEDAFKSFTLLMTIIIPESVTEVGEEAFSSTELLFVYYKGTETQWDYVTINGNNKGLYEYPRFFFVDFPVSDSGTCGDTVVWNFDATSLTLTISGTGPMYNDLGDYRYFSDNNIFIGDRGWDCYKYHIEKIVITDGVTTIGSDAFNYHPNLKEVVISDTVTEIRFSAFTSCKALSDIYYSGTEEEWNDVNIWECLLLGVSNSSYKPNNATLHYNSTGPHTHDYEDVITAPTCTEQGYTTYTCECGDSYVADYVNATGHTEETIPALAPTCTETGFTDGVKCSVCGETLTEKKELPANGHSPANAVEENYVAPTCTENGSKDVVVYCSVCEEEISRDTVVINATGHSYTTVTTTPTCTEGGFTTYTCECGETHIDDYVNATGHADNDGDGYCDTDNELLDPSVECDHICHKDGILGFVWRIINVFNMLFGLNKTCECGVLHY